MPVLAGRADHSKAAGVDQDRPLAARIGFRLDDPPSRPRVRRLVCGAAPHVVTSAFLGLPGLHRQRVLRRSKAWIWDFSSMLSTIAFSGGLRYNPTTSVTLATLSRSAESLNEHHCQTT